MQSNCSRLHSLSLRGRALHPNTRIDVRLLGPCFKTGRLEPLRQRPWINRRPRPHPPYDVKGYNTPRRVSLSQDLSPASKADAGPTPDNFMGQKSHDRRTPWADAKRFPFNNFTYCFTSFSRYLSSFDHSTCLLSVSRQYLALDEIYHPF